MLMALPVNIVSKSVFWKKKIKNVNIFCCCEKLRFHELTDRSKLAHERANDESQWMRREQAEVVHALRDSYETTVRPCVSTLVVDSAKCSDEAENCANALVENFAAGSTHLLSSLRDWRQFENDSSEQLKSANSEASNHVSAVCNKLDAKIEVISHFLIIIQISVPLTVQKCRVLGLPVGFFFKAPRRPKSYFSFVHFMTVFQQ